MGFIRQYMRRARSSGVQSENSGSEGKQCVNQAHIESKRANNVVDALYEHFKKWKPEVLEGGTKCQQPIKDAFQK